MRKTLTCRGSPVVLSFVVASVTIASTEPLVADQQPASQYDKGGVNG